MHNDKPVDTQTDYLGKLGYESRDIELKSIAGWIVKLFIFLGVTSVATWGIYLYFVFLAKGPTPQGGPAIARRLPADPNPLVQPYPIRDIRNFRQEEDEKLETPKWKDRRAGVVSIPVSRAIDLVLERHMLPARGQTKPVEGIVPSAVPPVAGPIGQGPEGAPGNTVEPPMKPKKTEPNTGATNQTP